MVQKTLRSHLGKKIVLMRVPFLSFRAEMISLNFGTRSFDIYAYLYRKTYRFSLKNKPKFIVPSESRDINKLLVAGSFGQFDRREDLRFIEEGYVDAFEPEYVSIGHEELADIQTGKVGTPLEIGRLDLECHPKGLRANPILFLCRGDLSRDVIDFWNLCALGFDVRAVAQNPTENALCNLAQGNRGLLSPLPRQNKKIWNRTTVACLPAL